MSVSLLSLGCDLDNNFTDMVLLYNEASYTFREVL